MTTTTFNPSDKTANIALTNGNLTATATSGSNGGVRGTTSKTTGKIILRYVNVLLSDSLDYIGLGSAADVLGLAQGSQDNQLIVIEQGTSFSPKGALSAVTPTLGATGAPHTVDIAVDLDAALYWMRGDGGDWSSTFGPSDPALGTGGIQLYTTAGETFSAPVFPYIRLTGTASTATLDTLNPTGIVGFTPWDAIPVPVGSWSSHEAADTMAASGYSGAFGVVGDLTAAESPDVMAGVGFQPNSGTMVSVETADKFSAFIVQPLTLVWNSTEAIDTMRAAGIGLGEDGIWASAEMPDIFAASGNTPISGTFDTTEAADRFRMIGAGVIRVGGRRNAFVT